MSSELWTDKYQPKNLKDIVGQDEAIRRLDEWIRRYKDDDDSIERCVLLTGQSGIGKTSSSICLLESHGYQVREFNASDLRTKVQLEESLYHLIKIKQVQSGKPIAIIMDEIDGMSGGEKGGLGELIRYINPNRGKGNQKRENKIKGIPLPPIICICNNSTDKKFQEFLKDCLVLHFKPASPESLKILLRRICANEGLHLNDDAEELVIEYAQRDYRRLITYLQSLDSLIYDHQFVLGVAEIEQCNSIIGHKSLDLDLSRSFRYLLGNRVEVSECLKLYNNHKSQFICSIYENYIHILGQRKDLPVLDRLDKMQQVIDYISWSDIIDKVMHKNQLWYLQKIHGLYSCHLPIQQLQTDKFAGLQDSSSWSMFNLQKGNEKDIYNLSSKLKTSTGTIDIHTLSQIVLHQVLDNPTEGNLEQGIATLKDYGLDQSHLKMLDKIDRLTKHKKLTSKMEKKLKVLFPVKNDGFEKKKKTRPMKSDEID